MRYRASIEIDHADGQPPPDDACEALISGIRSELNSATRITVSDLAIARHPAGRSTIDAILAGLDNEDLTNPLHALTLLDTALDEALLGTGLFEEFDVARRRLTVTPHDPAQR